MLFTAWKQEGKNRDRKPMTSGGIWFIVTNNSLNDSK